MKEKKKSDLAVLLEFAGSYKSLTFLGLGLSAVAMVLGMACSQLDTGLRHRPLWLDGLRFCRSRYSGLFRGSDVHTSGCVPYRFQYTQTGHGASDEDAARLL